MDLKQKYQAAYDELESTVRKRAEKRRYPAMGYTSNLDLLCDFKTERLNELLEEHTPKARLDQMKAAEIIRTMQDLLETMVYYCSNGIGGEVDVENVELIKETFDFSYGMGGTAVQAALALNSVGCPSVVHLTDDSKEVCDILNTPQVYTVSQDGRLVHTDEIRQTNEQEPHFIIQFKKGDSLVSSNVLSSFNALLNPELLKERLNFTKEHVAAYRVGNPEGIVFFEDAHFHSIDVKKLCLETIGASVDILSMNEEELNHTLNHMYQEGVDVEDIISSVEGAKSIRRMFGVRKGVVIHTKDYSMYVGEPLKADIERGLIYGNLLATAKANNGWYGTKEQVKEVLEFGFGDRGMKNYQTVRESKYAEETVLVPSKYMDKPKFTIGLGDSFVGGVQMCF